MSTTHYCEWTTPISHLERFSLWSQDVQKVLDYLPRYVAGGRKQRFLAMPIQDIPGGESINLSQLAEYDETIHKPREHYFLITNDIGDTQPLLIRGPEGTGAPLITDDEVAFNIDISEGDSHEPFLLRKETMSHETGWLFWKTPWSPHDLLVTASLIRLAHHFLELHISSDTRMSWWWEASILCKEVFGVGAISV